ncbi:MAG: redoxin domain-containing protein [Desulfobulbia bacterium]
MKKTMYLIILSFFVLIMMGAPAESFALGVGDKAPSVSGNSTQGKIQLTDYKGKKNVVLALFFAAFTPV